MSQTDLKTDAAAIDDDKKAPSDPMEGFKYSGSEDEEGTNDPKVPAETDTTKDDDEREGADRDGDQSGSDDGASSGGEDGDDAAKAEKQQKIDERFANITRKRREAERAAAAEAERREALEEENRILKQKLGLTDSGEEIKSLEAPDATKYQYGEFDPEYRKDYEKYLDAKFDAKLAEERAKTEKQRQAEASDAAAREHRTLEDSLTKAGIEKYDDFEKVVLEGPLAEFEGPPLSKEAGDLILKSANGHDILYHLASNTDEARDLASKSPIEQALHIGKLEAKFSSPSGDAPTKTESTKPTAKAPAAPPPPTRTRGSDGKFSVSDDTNDFAAFEAKHRFKKAP